MSKLTTPRLRRTPPEEGNTTPPLRGTPPKEGSTTPPFQGTPPKEGNESTRLLTAHSLTGEETGEKNSPPPEGWQAKPDGVVPALRFPEFRDKGEWEEKRLENVAPLQRGFDLPTQQLELGNVPVVYSNGVQNYHKEGMAKGPGLVTGRSGTIGKLNFIEAGDYWPHNTTLWVTSFKNNVPKFVYFLYVAIGMERFASGSGVPTLNRNYVHAFIAYIPQLKDEQQKIADCLTSIDELITTQSQKLDALKTHKKGLMQQLFPAEGETVPKLRFPEFRDKGEWGEKFIRDLGEIITGSTPSTTKPEYYSGDRLFVSPADISDQRFVEKTKTTLTELGFSVTRPVKPGSILFVCIGSTIGKIAQNHHECATNQQINAVVPSENYVNGFVYYSLENNSEKISGLAGNHAVPIINKTAFGAIEIRFPKLPEQQKIADCLTSLDDLITAQSKKIETLKAHKKGLMQQLFPAMDEVGT